MENLNDVNHLDPSDEGLKAVMGRRFHDETTGGPTPAKKAAPAPAQPVEVPSTRKNSKEVLPAKWEPVKPAPTWMDRLRECVKWTGLFGALCSLFFYWQQTGLMAPAAAVPSMCACCLLAGLSIGSTVTK